ncbi:small ribosomal subunit protein mS39 [Brachyhypopomus gauderio]|uniref:small ribosomal subunit protein mS39 n=1 Tax=Brachyhypopomus gauderio TaxID=698409 RepID=UPI0040436107
MASCSRVGRQLYTTARLFSGGLKEAWCLRYCGLCSASKQPSSAESGSEEESIIPKKKTWSDDAVLQALLSTVNRDPTAAHYMFQDDSYLTPRTTGEYKLYSLSQESGRNAAKYFINTFPRYFQKDFADPHIPCLMPETLESQIAEVSEAALAECIQLRRVKASVDMFDQLMQIGTSVSLDITNDLLDLICLYGDHEPAQDDVPEQRAVDMDQDEMKKIKGRPQRASDLLKIAWRENNNAERIFNMMTQPSSRSYGALIRGMVKHGSFFKAFNTFNDMLNNRLTADVHTFNALISAAPEQKEKYSEKWDLIINLLKQMAAQKVKPNVLTFNSVLKALRRCGALARVQAVPVLNEMKALGIVPSLASYAHILGIFHKAGHTEIIQDVMTEMSGKSFTAQDPDDVSFFTNAMKICLDTKDIEQAYRLQSLLDVGENWKLLGDSYYQSIYYGRFFSLLCIMEHVDVVLNWYRKLVPSLYYPNSQGFRDLLQALDMDSRLDLIPQIWKDIKQMGHENKPELVEEMLSLMAREKQKPEVQQSFAECALDVKARYKQTDCGRQQLTWSASSITSITLILLAAERTQQAWEMLKLFKVTNRVPPDYLLNQFLDCIHVGNPQQAVELVQISVSFCLPVTPYLLERVQQEFELNEEQKNTLSQLELSMLD